MQTDRNNSDYSDIIHRKPPTLHHPRMPRADRAKQFGSFKALTGFEEQAHENDTEVVPRMTLSEDEIETLDRKLSGSRPGDEISVTHYVAATPPRGVVWEEELGVYVVSMGRLVRVDTVHQEIVMAENNAPPGKSGRAAETRIKFCDIVDVASI